MNFIKRIFGSVQPGDLIRAYVLSAAFMAFMIWMVLSLDGAKPLHDRAADRIQDAVLGLDGAGRAADALAVLSGTGR